MVCRNLFMIFRSGCDEKAADNRDTYNLTMFVLPRQQGEEVKDPSLVLLPGCKLQAPLILKARCISQVHSKATNIFLVRENIKQVFECSDLSLVDSSLPLQPIRPVGPQAEYRTKLFLYDHQNANLPISCKLNDIPKKCVSKCVCHVI